MLKIYTTPTCVFCEMAKEFLKKKGIKYQEYDVSRDRKAQKEMIAKSHQYGVPVFNINGKILISFNQIELENALRSVNRRRRPCGHSRGRLRRSKKT
jgi:glutaredoxin-like YruB-family protein